MHILMIARATLYSTPGGDTMQLEMTASHLRALGVQVTVKLSNENINYAPYDLLHYFNIIRPDDILLHLLRSKKPFVVSTIFVDYSELDKANPFRKGLAGAANRFLSLDQMEYVKSVARFIKNGERLKSWYYLSHGHRRSVQYIAQKAALLLPNSHSEYNRFVKAYGVSKKYQKVVNAIDDRLFADTVLPNKAFDGYVVCVARFEALKNQLNLIKAVAQTPLQLALIGKPSPNHAAFYAACKAAAAEAGNVRIIDHMPHAELPAVYKAARVHVLPSWFETTGLSSLEAAAMGCNLVITDKGDTREYFGDLAYYCAPDSVASIRDALLKAHQTPADDRLQQLVHTQYTWQKAAQQTLNAYQSILLN